MKKPTKPKELTPEQKEILELKRANAKLRMIVAQAHTKLNEIQFRDAQAELVALT